MHCRWMGVACGVWRRSSISIYSGTWSRRCTAGCRAFLSARTVCCHIIGHLETMHDSYLPTCLMRALPMIHQRTRTVRPTDLNRACCGSVHLPVCHPAAHDWYSPAHHSSCMRALLRRGLSSRGGSGVLVFKPLVVVVVLVGGFWDFGLSSAYS